MLDLYDNKKGEMGSSQFEAMRLGKPIIISKTIGMDEKISEIKNLFLLLTNQKKYVILAIW